MTFLTDNEILNLLQIDDGKPLATGIAPDNTSQIKAASLDLSIGSIYLPKSNNRSYLLQIIKFIQSKLLLMQDDVPLAHQCYCLGIGETAVIKTKEILNIPPDLVGIAFPPASLSLQGLLTTNPGHIDPGYEGPLHLTVINMSREPFPLKAGDRIIRVLFARLGQTPQTPYNVRYPKTGKSVINENLLETLSHDFVNVTERAESISRNTVKKAQIWATVIPVVVAIVMVGGTIIANLMEKKDTDVLSERVTKLESILDVQKLDQRVVKLEHSTTQKNNSNGR